MRKLSVYQLKTPTFPNGAGGDHKQTVNIKPTFVTWPETQTLCLLEVTRHKQLFLKLYSQTLATSRKLASPALPPQGRGQTFPSQIHLSMHLTRLTADTDSKWLQTYVYDKLVRQHHRSHTRILAEQQLKPGFQSLFRTCPTTETEKNT